MKKSKIKMLTASACLALVGTASAAWVYAGTATASANIGVKVASYASAGTITVEGADNYYLYLDKGSVSFRQKDENVNLVATHNVPSSLATGNETVTYTYTVTLKGMLANYVEFTENNASTWVDESDEDKPSYRTTTDRTWVSGQAITLPGLKWGTSTDGGTYDSFTDSDGYIGLVSTLFGIDLSADTSWNQNEEIDVAAELGYVKIDFKATVK